MKPLPARALPAIQAYMAGQSMISVATAHGTTPVTLRKWLVRTGVPIRRPGPAAGAHASARREQVVALHLEGKNLQEIGDALGITRERVRQQLIRSGISERHGDCGRREQNRRRTEALAREAIEAGISLRKASAKYDLAEATLTNAAQRIGLSFRGASKKTTKKRYALIAEYYRDTDGTTINKTAAHFGICFATVARALAVHGISDRRKARA